MLLGTFVCIVSADGFGTAFFQNPQSFKFDLITLSRANRAKIWGGGLKAVFQGKIVKKRQSMENIKTPAEIFEKFGKYYNPQRKIKKSEISSLRGGLILSAR